MNNIDCGRKLPPRNRDDNAFHTFCSFFFAGGGGGGEETVLTGCLENEINARNPESKRFKTCFIETQEERVTCTFKNRHV